MNEFDLWPQRRRVRMIPLGRPLAAPLRLMAVLSAVVVTVTFLPARTLTVDDDGPADFQVIQEAIDTAALGDVVLVAAGTYHENLLLKSGVAVVGAGADRTTIDGGGISSTATLIDCEASTRLEGFTLTGGLAESGGGVFVQGGAPVITFNEIVGNFAAATVTLLYSYGGGLAVLQSAAVIADNVLASNDADFGGGIQVEGGSPRITRNQITGNTAGVGGGIDVYAFYGMSAIITANTISSNTAIFGGGVELAGLGTPIVSNNLIIGNSATGSGPGTGYGGGADAYYNDARFFNNTVAQNSARIGGGVAVLSEDSPPLINNIFLDNRATNSGGAADLQAPGAVVLNNIFHLNSRDTCGGFSASLCFEPTNLETDPLLVDPGRADFRLRADSPAIDSATAEGAPSGDIRGQRRPLDGDRDGSPGFDRGAYEFDRNDVPGLEFATPSTLAWKTVIGAEAYHVYSGVLSSLSGGIPGSCRDADDADPTDQSFTEEMAPLPGDAFTYLATAVIAGAEQSPGFDHQGVERSLPAPCP